MEKYSIYEAKSQLSKLIKAALAGKRIVITHRDIPQVELKVISPEKREKRELGIVKGVWFMADDFDATPEIFDAYTK